MKIKTLIFFESKVLVWENLIISYARSRLVSRNILSQSCSRWYYHVTRDTFNVRGTSEFRSKKISFPSIDDSVLFEEIDDKSEGKQVRAASLNALVLRDLRSEWALERKETGSRCTIKAAPARRVVNFDHTESNGNGERDRTVKPSISLSTCSFSHDTPANRASFCRAYTLPGW